MRRCSIALVALARVGLGACVVPPPTAPPQFADRQTDPVVLTGAQVPSLHGVAVGDIVAFRYTAGEWKQFPVQVDQRKTVELSTVYHLPPNTTNPVNVTVYADPKTWVGGGSGVLADADEIAFMAADTGDAAPGGASPPGVNAPSKVQLTVTDPRNAHVAYAYLFARSGTTLKPDAATKYVSYQFKLSSGPYKTTYKLQDGPNPEASSVTTSFYTRKFSDRWLDDYLSISAGHATNADLVDRHKELFAPGVCVRSEDTFDDAEGAFIANIDGPVRAIRSYIGANSGPYTERTHIFYAEREDVITDLRVHSIPSVLDFMDYSSQARGMKDSNDHNTAGVTIDGAPDSVAAGAPAWEKVDGPQGALTHVWTLDTDASLTSTNYYLDNDTNPITQCTGDAEALGSSGSYVNSTIPNTDPHNGAANFVRSTRTMFYEAPSRSTSDAQLHAAQVAAPLTASAS